MTKDRAARREAVREYKDAHRKLHENSDREQAAGIRDETPEYLELNARANEAARNPNLPFWRR